MTRIVFMGSPDFAVPTLRALSDMHAVVGVVSQPDRPSGRGRGLRAPAVKLEASSLGLPLIQPERASAPDVVEKLVEWKPDLIVVAAFGQLLRPVVLGLPTFGCLNVHASLLPRWRGAAPVQAAIVAGDAATGVTIMKMDEGMDTGGIVAQSSLPILPEDSGGSLTDRLAVLGAEALRAALPGYLAGQLQPRPQDSARATKAPMLRKQDGSLNAMLPAKDLVRRVRAYQPWPGAYISLGDMTLKVLHAHATAAQLEPGTRAVLDRHPAWGTVAGALVLDIVQPPGKKPMDGPAFLLGSKNW